jgi:hypothetical protein
VAEGDEKNDFVPALWAERRVAFLLDEIRRNGSAPELVAEVQRLGREYHVVTPYTSQLIVEEGLRLGYRGPSDTTSPAGGPTGFGPSTPGAAPATRAAGDLDALRGLGYAGAESDAFFLGRRVARKSGEIELSALSDRLREAGVLPRDASPAELARLTREVAREMREAEVLRVGFGATTGGAAVDTSVYLARLMSGEATTRDQLLELFARRVKEKVFYLRAGVWTDRDFDAACSPGPTIVEAYSSAYFELLRARPGLAPYFALSPRLVVVLGSEAFEVREPPAEAR